MKLLNHKKSGKSTTTISLIIIGEIIFIIWLLFAWGTSLLKSYQRESAIKLFQEENNRLGNENQRLVEYLKFSNSEQFKDKWAKESKNKVNSGEKMIILPPKVDDLFEKKFEGLSIQERKLEILKSRPNREQWWEFFFGEKL